MTGGHYGLFKTLSQVQRQAYWLTWKTDVQRYCKACESCARYHRGNPPKQGYLQPFFAASPMELVSIDICGPFPRTGNANRFIITMVDHFTKYAAAYSVPNHTAETVAHEVMHGWISRFGTPIQLLSDQGAEFESKLFQELCRCMSIDKIRTSCYKPSTNAVVERFHRSLNSILAKIMNEHQDNWDEYVPFAIAAYNNSIHESTGFTPNTLVFGGELNNPIDIVLGQVIADADDVARQSFNSPNEYVSTIQDRMKTCHEVVRNQLKQCAQRRKKYYDLKVKPRELQPGQFVYYFTPRKIINKCNKWAKNWTGPYLIIRMIEPVNAVIQKSKNAKPMTVHLDKLKLHRGPALQA